MYIKLGRTAINYIIPKQDDFMVISCIPSSDMSPDKPTLIRGTQELRLCFGEKFPEYSYLSELLEQGVSLYLMGPTDNKENENITGYTAITKTLDNFYYERDLPEVGDKGTLYKVLNEDGNKVSSGGRYSEYIFLKEEGWIDIRDLPQNTWINTDSQNNRDTLRLCKESNLFCHPPYGVEITTEAPFYSDYYEYNGTGWVKKGGVYVPKYVFNTLEELKTSVKTPRDGEIARIDTPIDLEVINSERIDNDEDSLAFDIINGDGTIDPGEFIGLGKTLYGHPPEDLKGYSVIKADTIEDFLSKVDWKREGDSLIPKDLSSPITYFYNHRFFKLEPSWKKSQQLLASYTTPIVEFYSKTIGTDGPESWITIKTEDLEEEGTQRVTIIRYDYQEVFEGSWLKGTIEEERLDYQISKGSKLVKAKWFDGIPPEGEWVLRGAEKLGGLKKDKTLEFIFKGETVFDFFLSWGDLPQQALLDYSLQKNCQCLIQNQGDDYLGNVIDKTNHLLFFYRPMTLYGVLERPAWYIWLRGLLNDIYSDTSENISYDSPAPDYNEDYPDSPCKDLRKYRSNYLTHSGIDFFYRDYAWMKDEQTAFARFVLGKISRELEKNKWDFIGPQPSGKTIPAIKNILEKIQETFGIIRSIEIVDYTFYYRRNMIELELETYISDLPNKDISLEITLNYNK